MTFLLNRNLREWGKGVQSSDFESGETGLGLAIAERAARLHGGAVTATNGAGGGLLVEIRLPLDAAATASHLSQTFHQ